MATTDKTLPTTDSILKELRRLRSSKLRIITYPMPNQEMLIEIRSKHPIYKEALHRLFLGIHLPSPGVTEPREIHSSVVGPNLVRGVGFGVVIPRNRFRFVQEVCFETGPLKRFKDYPGLVPQSTVYDASLTDTQFELMLRKVEERLLEAMQPDHA